MYNELRLVFTIIKKYIKNWLRQLHCYFVNNFTTTFVTFTGFIDKFNNIKNFQSLL